MEAGLDEQRSRYLPSLRGAEAGRRRLGFQTHSFTEQRTFTDGRIVVAGQKYHRKPKTRVDYLPRLTRDHTDLGELAQLAATETLCALCVSGAHTRTPWGALRWWWSTCPLSRGGVSCGRRCGKLYLPPGGRYHGCRRCYNLTYSSCHESRKYDAMALLLARNAGMDWRDVPDVPDERDVLRRGSE